MAANQDAQGNSPTHVHDVKGHVKQGIPGGDEAAQTAVNMASPAQSGGSTLVQRLLAALFYGSASFFIIVVNKVVLTSYKFPSFQVLGLGQMYTTVVVLYLAKLLKIISFPDISKDLPRKIFPLPLIYLGNLTFGLGGTQKISLPMFVVLRRFTILITMIAEFYVLGIKASRKVQFCVFLMLFGAMVAASNDLAFNAMGYFFILANDFFTAANGVFTKQKLDAKDLGKYGVLFYNSLFMLIPATALAYYTGELHRGLEYDGWDNMMFLGAFSVSCVMGFILNYSIVVCTLHNSALTTTIIGVLKNMLTTYLGMMIGGDYIFSWVNFIGLNVSVVGSIIYSYITFTDKNKPEVREQPKSKGSATGVHRPKTKGSKKMR